MATTYDASTFDMSVLPGGLHRDAQALVHGALALGWKIMVKQIMVRLISPDGEHIITISASNKNIPYERYKREIHKYANPLLIPKNDKQVHAVATDAVKAENAVIAKRKEREAQKRAESEQRKAARKAKVSGQKPAMAEAMERAMREVPAEAIAYDEEGHPDAPGFGRYVVSEVPMMAHRGQGKGYPSPTTNERTWSDGTVDYTCRSEGCDFSVEKRMGVGSHWRSHVARGEEQPAPKPKETYVTPPHEPAYTHGYTPRRERVTALSRVLEALDLTAMTAEELAEFVLSWQHEQSEAGTRVAAEREEMTADDVLNRIRSLLDNGTYLAQQERITALEQDVQSLVQDVTVAQMEAQRAKETLATFRELVAEVDA